MTESKKNAPDKPEQSKPAERPKPNMNVIRPGLVAGLESLDLSEKKK